MVPGKPPFMLSPLSKNISLQGPQGPESPMDQKLSLDEILIIFSSLNPEIFFQILKESSSSLYTVIINLFSSIEYSFVNKSHASFIASSLK